MGHYAGRKALRARVKRRKQLEKWRVARGVTKPSRKRAYVAKAGPKPRGATYVLFTREDPVAKVQRETRHRIRQALGGLASSIMDD